MTVRWSERRDRQPNSRRTLSADATSTGGSLASAGVEDAKAGGPGLAGLGRVAEEKLYFRSGLTVGIHRRQWGVLGDGKGPRTPLSGGPGRDPAAPAGPPATGTRCDRVSTRS